MERITRTWQLMGFSWSVLRQDKTLMVLPLLSGLACLAVLAAFAVPLVVTGMGAGRIGLSLPYYGALFVYMFVNYFVVTFFNTALISCALGRLRGGSPTVGDGLREATSRLHLVVGWALFAATVGLVLRMIEDRSRWLGRLVAGLLGIAFSIGSFLVLPVMVAENRGPIDALRESADLLRKTWGEQLIGKLGFGLVFLLLSLPAVLVVVLGMVVASMLDFSATGVAVVIATVVIAVLYAFLLWLVQSALAAIFQAAVYLNGRTGMPVPGLQITTTV